MRSIKKAQSVWYIDIQVLVSRKQKSHSPPFQILPAPLIYAKNPFSLHR